MLAVLEGATASGAPLPVALQREIRKTRDERDDGAELLLVPPAPDSAALFPAHRSHRSHSSHSSGSGRRSHYSGGGGYEPAAAPAPPPPPRRLRPANVSFVAYPGGNIFVDGRPAGRDTTRVMRLAAGDHVVRVENAFVGDTEQTISLSEGETGIVAIRW